MIKFKNKRDKKGNLIPWDTSLVHKESETKLSLRATERSIEKSKILPNTINITHLVDEKNNQLKNNLIKHLLASSKRKRNQVLIVQIINIKNNVWLFFVNDLRGGRKWFWHKKKNISYETITLFCKSILRIKKKNIVFLPHKDAVKYFKEIKECPNEVFIKSNKYNGYFPFSCYRKYLNNTNENLTFKNLSKKNTNYLNELESESIHIIREVVAEAKNPVMLYSIGKDSAVMLHLAAKAFFPAPIPFPLLHVDTTWKFDMMYQFRSFIEKKYDIKLLVHSNEKGIKNDINPFDHGSVRHTQIMKTDALLEALEKYNFDIAFGGARRDEEKSRSKERVLSFRNTNHKWDPKNQRPELWSLYNTKVNLGESIRAFPISNWTEFDVWNYIRDENIDIVPLYYSEYYPVVKRNNTLIMVDDERLKINKNENIYIKKIRFRTLGCYPLTGAIESSASNIDDVILELTSSRVSERQGRLIDTDEQSSMEKKKIDGYF